MKKRDFIKISLLGAAGSIAMPTLGSNLSTNKKRSFEALPSVENLMYEQKLFSKEELLNHHQVYFSSPANYLSNLKLKGRKSRKIFKNSSNYSSEVLLQAGSFFNHRMYFKSITGNGSKPGETISRLINKSFGSFDNFQKEFDHIALNQIQEGWVWLVIADNTLKITTTTGNNNPLMSNTPATESGFPLIALDNWNHASNSKKFANKEAYLNSFWASMNWAYIEKRYKRSLR